MKGYRVTYNDQPALVVSDPFINDEQCNVVIHLGNCFIEVNVHLLVIESAVTDLIFPKQ